MDDARVAGTPTANVEPFETVKARYEIIRHLHRPQGQAPNWTEPRLVSGAELSMVQPNLIGASPVRLRSGVYGFRATASTYEW